MALVGHMFVLFIILVILWLIANLLRYAFVMFAGGPERARRSFVFCVSDYLLDNTRRVEPDQDEPGREGDQKADGP